MEFHFLSALFLIVLLSENKVSSQSTSSDSCPVPGGADIGTQFSELSRSSRSGLFMNFGAPAQCNGTVISWRYCSYNRFNDDECDDPISFQSVFMAFRRTEETTYEPITGSMKYVTLQLRCPRDGGFRCRDVTLSANEQFKIKQNDIVAACLITSRRSPISVVGRDRSTSGRVYQVQNTPACSFDQLSSVETQGSAFILNEEFRLHLNAKTDTNTAIAQYSGGSNPPPFTPSLNSGIYFNQENPITRTDTITSWHYCYYPSAAANSQLTYTATVGVWRLNAAMNQYELLPGSDHTLELVQPASTPAKIFCKTEVLQPSEYVPVQTGDVIGVDMPTQNPLPLVASDAPVDFSLMKHSGINAPAAVQMSTLSDAPNMAMHLFPTVEFSPTQPPISVSSRPVPGVVTPPIITRSPRPITPRPTENGRTWPTEDGSTWPTEEGSIWPTTGTVDEEDIENLPESAGKGSTRAYYIVAALGVVILVIIIIVVAAVVTYKCRKSEVKGPAVYGGTRVDLEGSLTQRRLLTASIVSTGSSLVIPTVPYFTKEEGIYESIPNNSTKEKPPPAINEYSQNSQEVYYAKLGASSSEYSSLLEQAIKGKKFEDEENPYFLPAKRETELYAQLHNQGIKNIKSEDIEVTSVLGEGQFGTVSQGIWRTENSYVLEVAIKTLKQGCDERDKVKCLQEAIIMAQFKHPNVVTLYGVVSSGGPMMIVVELLPNGDLQQHLLDMKSDPNMTLQYSFIPMKLLGFCQQIALGMQYLSTKGFVHRDLAARNILISEGGICKITDFGMSIDLAEETYYVAQGGRIPLKWTAPEALHYRKYSTASDIWSYGCLMYEIWSLGGKPFGITKNRKVITQIDSGYRLPPPPGCPKEIYRIMIDCWHPTTSSRPGFRKILLALLDKEEKVLKIPREVGKNSPASVLGAPLEAGYNMYTQLQNTYRGDYA